MFIESVGLCILCSFCVVLGGKESLPARQQSRNSVAWLVAFSVGVRRLASLAGGLFFPGSGE